MYATKPAAEIQILYVEDDPTSGRLVQSIAESEGHSVRVVGTGKEFLHRLLLDKPDLLLVDLHLPDAFGLDLVGKAHAQLPEAPIIVLTASNDIEHVVKALNSGAIDYLTKPIDHQRFVVSLTNAIKMLQQQRDLNKLRSEVRETYKVEHMIGSSPEMERVRDLIRQAAPTDSTVLITGESGTGKELVARALHYASPRVGKPFIDINCAALTETLIESELFGHERGAFTSALSRRRGKFEQADGGSIFLDEIGDMPLSTQAKILRVLQERSFERVGGEAKINVNVRVICATNKNLETCVERGTFRLDLFYRINLFVIELPPLRERKADIPELAQHFLATGCRSGKCRAQAVSDAALEVLSHHSWPGNIRELQNSIERALTICDEEEIQPAHLPPALFRRPSAQPATAEGGRRKNLIEALEEFERTMIVAALKKHDWNKSRAALALGVTRRILSYKMQNLGLEKPSVEVKEPV
jgi:DNA-binding NtrC family response regulator